MKIVVVIPDDRQLATAGVRIRYMRLKPQIEAAGHSFELVPIDNLRNAAAFRVDVCLFSKCHDARALLAAEMMRQAGAAVGVDVFDDYYSNRFDSRFVHLREWMRAVASSLSFVVCSTPRMAETLRGVLPGVPLHVTHDPYDAFDPVGVGERVARNVERTLSTRTVDVGWFGIGDNPHFSLGLYDLSAYGGQIADIRRSGFEPRVSIITNRRALDAERLQMISRLPVPCALEEWSEDSERELIAASLFCFLPVNAQAFSVVKSLNRAVTTLTGGSQALGAGYPLYGELKPFIYGDVARLIADVERGEPALRLETAPQLLKLLDRWGGPGVEADRLMRFLQDLPRRGKPAGPNPVRAVIHGRRTVGVTHKLAQRLGHLSVASPFSRQSLNFDVRFAAAAEGLALLLSSSAAALVKKPLRSRMVQQDGAGKPLYLLPLSALRTPTPGDLDDILTTESAAFASTCYRATMGYVSDLLNELFGDVAFHLSELDSPFWADARGTFATRRAGAEAPRARAS